MNKSNDEGAMLIVGIIAVSAFFSKNKESIGEFFMGILGGVFSFIGWLLWWVIAVVVVILLLGAIEWVITYLMEGKRMRKRFKKMEAEFSDFKREFKNLSDKVIRLDSKNYELKNQMRELENELAEQLKSSDEALEEVMVRL